MKKQVSWYIADIEYDEIRNPTIFWIWRIFLEDDFMQWAVAILKLISKKEGWEESETHYYHEFNKYLESIWQK